MTLDIKEYVKSCYEYQWQGELKKNNWKSIIVFINILKDKESTS